MGDERQNLGPLGQRELDVRGGRRGQVPCIFRCLPTRGPGIG